MKLRSLFLASLATIAMASCSNEENAIVDNGQETTKDAIMQFGITYSNAVTRGVTAGNNEAGIAAEQAFTDATIVIEQAGKRDIRTVDFKEFTDVTEEGGATHTPTTLWLKEKISVKEGAASVWVFLNASESLKASLASATDYSLLKEYVDFSAGIQALEATGKIAEANKFLMSNATGEAVPATFTKGEINPLTVCVSRVASKLEEKTPKGKVFDVADDAENLAHKKLEVKLTDFAYTGLQQEVAVLKGGTVNSSLYKPYGTITNFEYQSITEDGISNYCMENLAGTDIQSTTNVVYKGEIYVDGKIGTLYITSDNKAFSSIQEMVDAGYKIQGLTEDTSIEDCWNLHGLRKYDKGICYYVGQIKTASDNSATIVRNNIYRLSVNTIKGLGTVLPKIFEEFTLLDLTVEIDPWTVNLNSFDF